MSDATRDILIKARELISTPDKWLQGSLEHKGRYCAGGAILVACYGEAMARLGDHSAQLAAQKVAEVVRARVTGLENLGYGDWITMVLYNNTHTHAEVLAVFDAAIGPRTDISELTEMLNPANHKQLENVS